MPAVHIITRTTKAGAKRYLVRFRIGGRESRLLHGGAFSTLREAQERARWIGGELAAHRVPDIRLAVPELQAPLAEIADRYLATRIDATDKTLKTYRQAVAKFGPLGKREPGAVAVADVQAWIARMIAEKLAPATIRKYLDALRQVLDFADVEPNPARSRKLRLPRADEAEVDPPTADHVAVLVEAISPRYRLPVRLLDWTGLRVGELALLRWGDLDFRGSRLRVARGRTKGGTAGRRWVPVPVELLADVADMVPPEDRDLGAAILPGLSQTGLRNAMTRACKLAGIPAYSPHDLRHRYISLLVMAGVPLPVVSQVVGHSRANVTLRVYSHVMLDEPPEALAARRSLVMECGERNRGDASVMPRDSADTPETPSRKGISGEVGDTGLEPVTPSLSS